MEDEPLGQQEVIERSEEEILKEYEQVASTVGESNALPEGDFDSLVKVSSVLTLCLDGWRGCFQLWPTHTRQRVEHRVYCVGTAITLAWYLWLTHDSRFY
jgi:hypothetical protein